MTGKPKHERRRIEKTRSAILNSIAHANSQLERALRTVNELQERIDKLTKSLQCEHEWNAEYVDSAFDIVECVHCGYRCAGTVAGVELKQEE